MPVQYAAGIRAQHLATRNDAGLFDVSHMVQVELSGNGADAFFERLTPTDIGAVTEERVRYSMLLNDTGGVLDEMANGQKTIIHWSMHPIPLMTLWKATGRVPLATNSLATLLEIIKKTNIGRQ